jgi:hypothetical protein
MAVPPKWTYSFGRASLHESVAAAEEMEAWAERARFFNGYSVNIPLFFPVLVASFLAALPQFVIRYSLQTLLVAMTLVAVGLGMMVWASN